jgi:hypothetical protein
MSAEKPLPCNGDTGATGDEVELAQVLESYLAGLEAGSPSDPEELIAAHTKLGRPLRACLKVMHFAQGLGEPSLSHAEPLADDGPSLTGEPALCTSALTAVWPGDGRPPHVLLPEPPEDDSPVLRMHTED